MAGIKKVEKEDIINACVGIIKNEGMENINARRIAKELGCSTQPIYYIYSNMDELKKEALEKITNIFYESMFKSNYDRRVYKDIGINYIKFAKEEPILFKLLFDSNITKTVSCFMNLTGPAEEIKDIIANQTGLSKEQACLFHKKMWLYINGIASLIANKTCNFTDEEIDELLSEQYKARIFLEIQNGTIKKDILDYMKNNKLKKKVRKN